METRCSHIGFSYQLAARVLLYAPFHRQDSTYHGLCYTSRGALAGTRNMLSGRHSSPSNAWNSAKEINLQTHSEKTSFRTRHEMFYLTTHSTHFIYGYMASDIWLRTILIVRKETRCCHIGYSYQLAARVLLYAPSHRQDSTYHSLCYTSRGALAGMRNMLSGRHSSPSNAWNSAKEINLQTHSEKTSFRTRHEMFYLTTHSTHFIYGYMARDIW